MLNVAIATMLAELLYSNFSRVAEIYTRIQSGGFTPFHPRLQTCNTSGVEYKSLQHYAPYFGAASTYD